MPNCRKQFPRRGLSTRACLKVWAALAAVLAACGTEGQDVRVTDAWVRATVPGQKVAAAYLTIESATGATLTRVEVPKAKEVELHTMRVEDGVMQMRRLESLAIPPSVPVELKPGGDHLMLIDVAPLAVDETLPIKLTLKRENGVEKVVEVLAKVRAATPSE
jgi:copper(I)-binding protein